MARVPQYPPPSKIIFVKSTAPVAEQRAFLADFDRQIAVIDAKKLDKNGNYEK